MDPFSASRLREIPRVRQSGDTALHRRWFTSPGVDLFVWEGDEGLTAFELCYGKSTAEHCVRWSAARGLQHARVDDGESTPFDQRTPIMTTEAPFDPQAVALALEAVAADLPAPVFRHVLRVLYLGR